MEHLVYFILLFLLFVFFSLIFYNVQSHTFEKLTDYKECIENIININDVDDSNLNYYSDSLVYFYSENDIASINNNSLNDNDFHIRFHRNVLRYKRKVEYCQWVEHVKVHTDPETEIKTTTYSYVQSWLPKPVSSLYYNEAVTHVNPQRDPYSSKTVTLPDAKIGKIIVNENLITQLNSFRNTRDDDDMFIEPAGKYANAYNEHQFEYIGNGCFYSQYEKVILNSRPDTDRLPIKTKITEYLQQRHLVGLTKNDECIAGDILIEFSIIKPDSISILAKAIPHKDGYIMLDSFKTKHNYDLYFIYAGKVSVDDIVKSVSSSYTFYTWLFYLSSTVCFIFLVSAAFSAWYP